jgi:hypothetical protein
MSSISPRKNGENHSSNGNGRPASSRKPVDWQAKSETFQRKLKDEHAAELARILGVPPAALAALAIGYCADGPHRGDDGAPLGRCWIFPETDAKGGVIGLNCRYVEGQKKAWPGGRRGLTLPEGWKDRGGPIVVVEGASCVLAGWHLGLRVIGRSTSSPGNAEMDEMVKLLAPFPAEQPIILFGENDRKSNGHWPGRDGALKTATELAKRLERQIQWALPAGNAKDVRAWCLSRSLPFNGSKNREIWGQAGTALMGLLELNTVDAQGGGRPTILITLEEMEVNDQAVAALAKDVSLYQRGGMLVKLVTDETPKNGIRWSAGPRIEALPRELLRERLAARATWMQPKGEDEIGARPPAWCVGAVHARGHYPGVRHLHAAVNHPILRPDGTILDRPGYDAQTGLLLYGDACEKPLDVPERPTRSDLQAAVEKLLDVVADFPFAADVHKSAWLAGLLTPLARFAFQGPAPLFLVDANTRGSGKGLLLDCISEIVTGSRFTVATYTSDEDELRKRITSLALAADRLVLLDNLEGRFGNAVLDAALTATSWSDRILGTNRTTTAPMLMTWFATGNNVIVHADTARRICHLRLESPLEKPEDRKDFRHHDLIRHVQKARPILLSSALTVLRAYCAAGSPRQPIPAWGSFPGWSDLVRGAIVWAGLPDPAKTKAQLQASADVNAEYMSILIACWSQLDAGKSGMTASDAIDEIKRQSGGPNDVPDHIAELKDAIEGMVGKLDARGLGYKLRAYRRRVFGDQFLDQACSSHKTVRWAVFPASSFHRGPETSPPSPPSPPFLTQKGGDGGDAPGDAWEG